MPARFDGKLVVAISSRALFDLDEGDRIFREEGLQAYSDYQIANENIPLDPGFGFGMVRKLLNLNALDPERQPVEVLLLSRNSADTGLRVFNSITHWGLPIVRAAFAGGRSPFPYVSAFGVHLFLSADSTDVRQALQAGVAAATLIPGSKRPDDTDDELRIAFDGDAVLFSDESERIYQTQGLASFAATESRNAHVPMQAGPFKGFLQALHALQTEFGPGTPIRTALVTARSAPAHERVIRTLRDWKIRIDESVFLGGLEKGQFLQAFRADIFFDDQRGHCESAAKHTAAGHVPHGVSNE
jgi:5'-nucleotidase